MNRKLSIATAIALGLFSCASRQEATTLQASPLAPSAASVGQTYRVTRVADGDTITVSDARNRDVKIRFSCVDSPEVSHTKRELSSNDPADLNQFRWGERARERLLQLIHQGGDRVGLTVVDEDRYGRRVAEVRLPNGTLVQEVLAREGLAVFYRKYARNCRSAASVERAEAFAKQQQAGIWSDSQFVQPSVWRHRNK